MTEQERCQMTPEEYIMALYNETEQGRLKITYYPILERSYPLYFRMDWKREDAESLVEKYRSLTSTIRKICEIEDVEESLDKNKIGKGSEYDIDVSPEEADKLAESLVNTINSLENN